MRGTTKCRTKINKMYTKETLFRYCKCIILKQTTQPTESIWTFISDDCFYAETEESKIHN